ncbi:MAG: hypothetical protein O3B09_02130, partial [Proteobacteria bacterium]|nr:hypothetical protein [Pseudomonadota bacterium]
SKNLPKSEANLLSITKSQQNLRLTTSHSSFLLVQNILELTLLFLSSFIAANIFPAQSESILAALTVSRHHNKSLLLTIAIF